MTKKEIIKIRKRIEPLLNELLLRMGKCEYDHHGNCQSHFLQEDCLIKKISSIIPLTNILK